MESKVCKKCHCAVMEPHHELVFWFKCPICGFTEFNESFLSEQERKNATINKMANRATLVQDSLINIIKKKDD